MKVLVAILLLVLFTTCASTRISQKNSHQVIVVNENAGSTPVMENHTDTSGFRDIDGNNYKTVQIGSQIWMSENLRVSRYMDGTPIACIADSERWKSLTSAAYCWVNNDSVSYAILYGALYNWYAVNSAKLCPGGWHVPSNSDWDILTNHLGGADIAGGKLKEIDTIHWDKPNIAATNESGFTAIPAGGRGDDGIFGNFGQNNILWSTSEFDAKFAWFRSISYYYPDIFGYCFNKKNGFSVRCLRYNK